MRDSPPEPEASARRYAFPRGRRLLRPRQFQNVYANRQAGRAHGRIVVLVWVPNNLRQARLGLAVSRRALRRAVHRNALKRQVREHFRRHPLPGVDLIVSCRRGLSPPLDARAVRADLARLWPRVRP